MIVEPHNHHDQDQEHEVTWEEIFELQNQTLKELTSRVEALEGTAPGHGGVLLARDDGS